MKLLNSPQMIHAAVMASFPSFDDPVKERILWRIDKLSNSTYILVQSERKPDFQHIVSQFGWPESNQKWDCLDYESFFSKIENGQIWRFRLTANPTYSRFEDGKRGKVCAHVTSEQQLDWLIGRARKSGFSIYEADDGPAVEIKQRSILKFQRNGKTVTISSVTFEGILKVDDADVLKNTMMSGFGRSKAYGCGMMTITGI